MEFQVLEMSKREEERDERKTPRLRLKLRRLLYNGSSSPFGDVNPSPSFHPSSFLFPFSTKIKAEDNPQIGLKQAKRAKKRRGCGVSEWVVTGGGGGGEILPLLPSFLPGEIPVLEATWVTNFV